MGDGDHIDMRGSTFYGPVTGKSESPRAAPSPTALSALPAAPAVFTGREDEVAELLGALDPGVGEGSESVVISAVAGLGGVGKTALALCVAHAARGRGWFSGGGLFVDLRGYDEVPVTADQAVLALLRALGVGDADLPPTADEQYARYRGELSSREPVLIVLDNASDPGQIAPLLPGEGGGHRVLVTSREVQDSLPVRQFRVDGLAPEASRELVDRSLRRYDPGDRRVAEEPEGVRQLAELCGHLPLALLIVSALLRRRRQRPVSTLVGELRAAEDRVRALRAKGVDQYGKELSLRPVFDVMYARMEPELARVFRLLGQAPGDSVGIGVAVSLTSLEPECLEPLLDELAAVSLITPFPGGERWVMHDLVKVYARLVAVEDPGAHEEVAEARIRLLEFYYQLLLSAKAHIEGVPEEAPEDYFNTRELALKWLDSERTGLLKVAHWTDGGDKGRRRSLLIALHLDSYLSFRRAFDDWATVTKAAYEAALQIHDSWVEANTSDAHGLALFHLRRFEEAETAQRRALRLSEDSGDAEGQAMAWDHIGLTLRALGRYDDAIDAHTRSAQIAAEIGLIRQTSGIRMNLGAALGEAGRTEEALDVFEEALTIHVELGDKRGETMARDSLGITLSKLGRHEEAVTAFVHVLGLCAESGDWHRRALAWNRLGLTWNELGLHDEALGAHIRALNWFVFFRDRLGEALARASIGTVLLQLDRTEEALSARRQALEMFQEFGDEPHIAAILDAHP
ncbi:tetratricopeptide repeat protein [Streptomyces prunicolor]|uniref:Tetratricopeptide repeat protein n=1 Tax=Streptomyces prunicolor TaxID=67348 RepID=A0ABU4F7Y6_9ACTN|nr:tetratricopeptide repeat protein [Streptomyces prunicolor]MDV7216700.1 tetratricopeptide repeat protein [Streptomyces prunicolor]